MGRNCPQYVNEENGRLLSPHKSLPSISRGSRDAVVNEGTGRSQPTNPCCMNRKIRTRHPGAVEEISLAIL